MAVITACTAGFVTGVESESPPIVVKLRLEGRAFKRYSQRTYFSLLFGAEPELTDAITLFDKFESKLQEFRGNLRRSAVELGKDWRTDRILRRLEALLIVADKQSMFLISGSGDIIEPDDDIIAIGSGGPFAQAAAKALVRHSELELKEIVKQSLLIASEICIYTNDNIVIEEL